MSAKDKIAPEQPLNAFIEFKELHNRKRISAQMAFMAGFRYGENLSSGSLDDSRRLDWVISHQGAEFDTDAKSDYIVAYLTSSSEHSNGVSGRFIARGETHRDCIDSFLRGDIKRID